MIDSNNLLENVEGIIILKLVNTEKNQEMLKDVPHREFLNLSITYHILIDDSPEMMITARVTDHLAEILHLNEEQLYQIAMENTRKHFPLESKRLCDFLAPFVPCEKSTLKELDAALWMVTTKQKNNGSIVLLYEEELQKLAQTMDSDLYLLPSSRHEIIAVSARMMNPESLIRMVLSVNEKIVTEEDFLADCVYVYDKNLRTISLDTLF